MSYKVEVIGGELPQEEIDLYVTQTAEKFNIRYPGHTIKTIRLTVDGDFVEPYVTYDAQDFERIRRITGYLVGTLERFNDAKRSEEHDRVKHDTCCCN